MACKCRNIVAPESITTAGGTTTITLPSTFLPTEGCVYQIPLSVAIPDGTNGTVIEITIGTFTGPLLNRLGSNVRMGTLNAQWVLTVMYLGDPAHFNLLSRRWRDVN